MPSVTAVPVLINSLRDIPLWVIMDSLCQAGQADGTL